MARLDKHHITGEDDRLDDPGIGPMEIDTTSVRGVTQAIFLTFPCENQEGWNYRVALSPDELHQINMSVIRLKGSCQG